MSEEKSKPNGGKGVPKIPPPTPCPISLEEMIAAEPIKVDIYVPGEDHPRRVILAPHEFNTGSFGYVCVDKPVIVVAGKAVKFQLSFQLVAVNSNPKKKEKP